MLNITNSSATAFVFEHVSPPVAALMRGSSCLIVLLNGYVFLCLVLRRHRLSPIYRVQLACLSFNDFVAGLSALLTSCLDTPLFMTNFGACSVVLCFFFSTQCATLYNILGICLSRLLRVKKLTARAPVWQHKHTLVYTAGSWLVSTVLCSLPFIMWTAPVDTFENKGCSLDTLFMQNVVTVMKMLGLIFLLPLALTNILYGIAFVLFKKTMKSTAPVGQRRVSIASQTTSLCTEAIPAVLLPQTTVISLTSNRAVASPHECAAAGADRDTSLLPNLPWAVPLNRTILSTSAGQLSTDRLFDNIRAAQRRYGIETGSVSPSSTVELNRVRQQKVRLNMYKRSFSVVCLILVFLNVFTCPAVLIVLVQGLGLMDKSLITRGVKFPLFFTIATNSVVNPILYTVMVPQVRGVLKQTLVYSFKKVFSVCL